MKLKVLPKIWGNTFASLSIILLKKKKFYLCLLSSSFFIFIFFIFFYHLFERILNWYKN
jgi:hypothetical protein